MISLKKSLLALIIVVGLAVTVIFPHSAAPQIIYAAGKTCPDVVKAALQSVDSRCSSTSRNSLCYGNVHVQVTPQADAPQFTFAKPGDKAAIQNIQTIQLSSLSADANDWGIALMRIQANLSNTSPGQNVTMLLFGNVQISDGTKTVAYPTDEPTIVVSPPAPLPTVTPTVLAANANKPTVTPRPTSPPKPSTATPVPQATTAPVFSSMQAFYFSSGVGEPSCNTAPEDGILIQSPKNGPKVTLVIDDAKVVIGSTVFFQAHAGKEMIISTLEGSAQVSAFGQVAIAGAGSQVRVPIDANLRASGPPSQPEPYDPNVIKALPAQHLPLKVTPASPVPTLAPGQINTTWRYTFSGQAVSGPCVAGGGSTSYNMVPVGADGTYQFGAGFTRSGNTYVLEQDYPAANNNKVHYRAEINLVSPTHAEGNISVVQAKKPFCRWTWGFQLDQVGGPSASAASTAAATAAQ